MKNTQLPITRLCFAYAMKNGEYLNDYIGSAIRGVFGSTLKKLTCVTSEKECDNCLLKTNCPYVTIFATLPPPATAKMTKADKVPHPLIFEIPSESALNKSEKELRIGVTLFGNGEKHLPYIIYAMEKMGERGIGRDNKTQISLIEAKQQQSDDCWEQIYLPRQNLTPAPANSPPIPEMPEKITIILQTPLRLRRNNKYINQHNFQFNDLFSVLLRRITTLQYFYSESFKDPDYKSLIEIAKGIKIEEKDLNWKDLYRYSSRQKKKLPLGGMVGSFTIEMKGAEELWQYLWIGQWVHAGKATIMGLGRYKIEANDLTSAKSELPGAGSYK